MRSIPVIIILLCALVIEAIGFAQTNNWSNRIVSKKKYPLTYWISHGANAVNVLIVDGKRFEHVRGLEKFYLPVPKTNIIVFVVDEKDYSVTYHVFKLDTNEDIAIRARGSVFGNTIGSVNSQDTVGIADDGKIVLCNLDQNAKSTLQSLTNLYSVKSLYYLDADKKAVVAEKTIYYDKAGNVIQEHDTSPPPF